MSPRITAVIPTYNRAHLLERAIGSVQQQTFRDLAINVYDNASTDETATVVERLAAADPRISYHRHPQNLGLLGNYNFAMRDARTEFYSFLADDDIMRPHYYEEAIEALDAYPRAMFFAGRTLIHNEMVGVRQLAGASWPPGFYEPSVDTIVHMIDEHFIGTSCLFRSAIRDSIGVFEAHASDRNYLIVAAAGHPFVAGERAVVEFTIHRRSFSGGGVSEGGAGMLFDGRYVIGLYEELEARLAREGVLAGPGARRILAALWRKYRMDLRWVLLTKSWPGNRPADFEEVLRESDRYRLAPFDRFLVHLALPLVRSRPLRVAGEKALAFAHRTLLRRREPVNLA